MPILPPPGSATDGKYLLTEMVHFSFQFKIYQSCPKLRQARYEVEPVNAGSGGGAAKGPLLSLWSPL